MKKVFLLFALLFSLVACSQTRHSTGVILGDLTGTVNDPLSGKEGQVYWNSTLKKFRQYDGTIWSDLGGATGAFVPLDEGSGIGYVRFDRDPTYYGNIGDGSFDNSWGSASDNTGGATGSLSFASGADALASGYASFAAGGNNVAASGNYSFATGWNTVASGEASAVFGEANSVSAYGGFSGGYANINSGSMAFAWGRENLVGGYTDFVAGYANTTTTPTTTRGYRTAIGIRNLMDVQFGGVALGVGHWVSSYGTTAVGQASLQSFGSPNAATSPMLVVGNGDFNYNTGVLNVTTRSNAFVVLKNGKVSAPKYGVNTFAGTPTYALGVNATGDFVEFAVPSVGASLTATQTFTGENTFSNNMYGLSAAGDKTFLFGKSDFSEYTLLSKNLISAYNSATGYVELDGLTQALTWRTSNTVKLTASAGGVDRNIALPDASGTVALTSDLSNYLTTNTTQTITSTGSKTFSSSTATPSLIVTNTFSGGNATVFNNTQNNSTAMFVSNTGGTDAKGISISNQAGTGLRITNSSSGLIGAEMINQLATGSALKVTTSGAGKGAIFNGEVASTGAVISGQLNGADTFTVSKEGNVTSASYKLSALNTAPASATATGTTGEIRVTATHIYVCTATNTWVRAALATW